MTVLNRKSEVCHNLIYKYLIEQYLKLKNLANNQLIINYLATYSRDRLMSYKLIMFKIRAHVPLLKEL